MPRYDPDKTSRLSAVNASSVFIVKTLLTFYYGCVTTVAYNTFIVYIYLNWINFRELENFAFREDLFSRMSCFTIFRVDLLSRIGYAENFRKY